MLKDRLFDWALKAGFNVTRKVPEAQVRALLGMLRPVTTDLPLVRLGGAGDGGYLVPDDLDGLVACFSPGVDVTATFESALLARGIPCFLADASVEAPPIDAPGIDFEKKFLGVVNDETFTTLDAWIDRKAPTTGDMLLQMDIEGHEWPVLLNMSDAALDRFRIIVLELHALTHCFDRVAFQMFEAALDRFSRRFHVVHAHPNNYLPAFKHGDIEIPYFLEVTLLRKDRSPALGFATQFPHPLDFANVPANPDYALPAIFRGGPAR